MLASSLKDIFRRQRKLCLALLLIVTLVPITRFSRFLLFPPGDGKRVEIVELGKGRPLKALAGDLEARHILSSARLFTLYARLKGGDARLKAGYYQFDDGMRPGQILAKMISGDVYQRIFALPEGYSSYQVAEMLEKRGIFAKDNFLAACRNSALLKEFGIDAASAEGYLFPGSYNILPGKTELEVVREMVQRQQAFLKESVDDRAKAKGVPVQKLLILASMVEKEAVLPAEKPLIAAVFQNRLRIGMRLQSDPTALYGVRAFAGKVRREDILKPTPYNTYLIPALPPGPIGNPGKDAIDAVLNPAAVPYLYFVGRGDGSHQFSKDLSSHNQAVQKYLKAPAAAAQGGK
ncbi:endolytic transglycosylase MltG [Geomonas anaerohicana]|uniref:endolytic transglycosylase MltG n=1 Tax=Geomonas anaerohicana TaxID=2798583 RepID=UPI002E296529|nr:endolytic transglycosylase MltG [Geomonas anaerohicana]